MKKINTDERLCKDIREGGRRRQKAIAEIYGEVKLKNQVVAFVKKNSGSHDDGVEIFHEGIISLDHNIRNHKYRGEGNLQGYLFSTCRFLWLNRLKRDKRMVYTETESTLDQISVETPESLSLAKEQKQVLDALLGKLGDKCKHILQLWKLSYSMEEIAEKVGLGNAGIARRQRYNCYQKLLKMIDTDSSIRTLLKPT